MLFDTFAILREPGLPPMGDGSRIRSSLRFRTTERVSASLVWPQTDNAVTLGEGGGFILPGSLAKRPAELVHIPPAPHGIVTNFVSTGPLFGFASVGTGDS